MVQKPIIVKLEHGNNAQKSNEEVKIQRISSSISPYHFIRLVGVSDNKINPIFKKSVFFLYRKNGCSLFAERLFVMELTTMSSGVGYMHSHQNTDFTVSKGYIDAWHKAFFRSGKTIWKRTSISLILCRVFHFSVFSDVHSP